MLCIKDLEWLKIMLENLYSRQIGKILLNIVISNKTEKKAESYMLEIKGYIAFS